MRFYILTTFFLAISTQWCLAQNKVPEEVRYIIEKYVKDSTIEYGFSFAKKWLHFSDSISFEGIKTGTPVQQYRVKYSLLDTCKDSISFDKLIYPDDYWVIPISFNGKFIYEVYASKSTGTWRLSQMGDLPTDNIWDKLHSVFPTKCGLSPILVLDGLNKFLYFPHIGKRKIYYIKPGWENDSLAMLLTGSLESLDDSQKLVKYWKKQGKGSRNDMDKLYPGIFKDKKAGGEK
jgi:hypothetical protein